MFILPYTGLDKAFRLDRMKSWRLKLVAREEDDWSLEALIWVDLRMVPTLRIALPVLGGSRGPGGRADVLGSTRAGAAWTGGWPPLLANHTGCRLQWLRHIGCCSHCCCWWWWRRRVTVNVEAAKRWQRQPRQRHDPATPCGGRWRWEEDGEERATLGKVAMLGASWSTGFSWSRRGRGWGDRCWRCQGGPLVVSSSLPPPCSCSCSTVAAASLTRNWLQGWRCSCRRGHNFKLDLGLALVGGGRQGCLPASLPHLLEELD